MAFATNVLITIKESETTFSSFSSPKNFEDEKKNETTFLSFSSLKMFGDEKEKKIVSLSLMTFYTYLSPPYKCFNSPPTYLTF